MSEVFRDADFVHVSAGDSACFSFSLVTTTRIWDPCGASANNQRGAAINNPVVAAPARNDRRPYPFAEMLPIVPLMNLICVQATKIRNGLPHPASQPDAEDTSCL